MLPEEKMLRDEEELKNPPSEPTGAIDYGEKDAAEMLEMSPEDKTASGAIVLPRIDSTATEANHYYQIGDRVSHPSDRSVAFAVVGIRATEIEIESEFPSGSPTYCFRSWVPIGAIKPIDQGE